MGSFLLWHCTGQDLAACPALSWCLKWTEAYLTQSVRSTQSAGRVDGLRMRDWTWVYDQGLDNNVRSCPERQKLFFGTAEDGL